jgi:hypothetical protein
VVFQLVDSTGNPVANQEVDFTLSTSVGGITLIPASGKTDGSGMVSTVVSSGTVHTSAVVTASLPAGSNVPDAQSSALIVSTGIPTQNNFSLSAASYNVEAYEHDGVTDVISVYLADRFNNPVPDGTAVAFTTDGGQIQPSCLTTGGTCTVTWTSADPRPQPPTSSKPGRVAILAYAVGEESFHDTNSDGILMTVIPSPTCRKSSWMPMRTEYMTPVPIRFSTISTRARLTLLLMANGRVCSVKALLNAAPVVRLVLENKLSSPCRPIRPRQQQGI